MPGLSRRSELIPFSPIRTMFRLADEMERSGGGPVYRLHVGDPDFNSPGAVVDGVCDAMRGGKTHYEQTVGLHELRAAYAEKARARNSLAATTEHVVVTPGSTQALFASMSLMLGPGDEMMLPEIYWPNYIQQVLLLGARPRFYPLGAGYQPDLEETRRAVTDRTRAILINSPSNPTGAVFSERTLRALYDLARERDLWVLSDEAYEDFVYGGAHVSPASFERDLPEEQRRVFTLFTFSKSYAMTGLRLGVIIAPSVRVTTMLRKCQEPLVASGNSPTQWGGLRALEASERAGIARMHEVYRRRRDLALSILQPAGMADYVPEGAFYIMADVSSTGMTGDEYAVALLREERVAVAPGAGFALVPEYGTDGTLRNEPTSTGAPEYDTNPKARQRVRIAFCVSDKDLEEGLRRMVRFTERHRAKAAAPAGAR
jgi:aspartate aminotransferase